MIGTEKSSAAGTGDRVEVIADQQRARLLEQQDQREGQQHLVEMLAGVEVAEQAALQHEARARCRRRSRPAGRATPSPSAARHQERHIGADHEQRAVGQIDDAHDAEDQRQPARDQEQQQAVLHAVEELREQAGESMARVAGTPVMRNRPVSSTGRCARQPQASLQPVPGSARFSTATPTTLFRPPSALRR